MTALNERAPARFSCPLGDGALAGWRWRRDGAPALLFCHATGFCASAYKQTLQPLAGRFDLFALDMRGHGRSTLPADPAALRSWRPYARDVAAFLNRQNRTGWTLAGHSMGAIVVSMAARGRRDVAALRLVEPVAPSPIYSALARAPFWNRLARAMGMARRAAARRDGWPTREAALKAYALKPVFRDWAPGVLEDYLEDSLRDEQGVVRLACAPAWEAATFAAFANDFWAGLSAASFDIRVLASDPASSTAPAGARRRFQRRGAVVEAITGFSHLVPMENPALAAAFLGEPS